MEKIRIIVQLKLKKPSDKYGIIRIRGYYDNRPVTSKSTGIKVHTDHWDANARAVIPAAPNASLGKYSYPKTIAGNAGTPA
jgi:hypothetical protein